MARTLGYHYVRSAYGLWLPGDERGHWSEAWDEQIGFIEPHKLHEGDPVRLRMAEERMAYPPVRWTLDMQSVITAALARCAVSSPWAIEAYCIEETHFHALLSQSPVNIERTVKWIGQMTTKAALKKRRSKGRWFARGAGYSLFLKSRIMQIW